MKEKRDENRTEFAEDADLLAKSGKLALSFDHHHAGGNIGQSQQNTNFIFYKGTFSRITVEQT